LERASPLALWLRAGAQESGGEPLPSPKFPDDTP
jgi:hypothetical protein